VTEEFKDIYNLLLANVNIFANTPAVSYIYLFVHGLYNGKIPGAADPFGGFERRRKKFAQYGLDFRPISIPSDGTVLLNATLIASFITDLAKKPENKNKLYFLIGHSKGAVDITAALTLFPEITQHIRAILSLQAPFLGSPVASDLLANKPAWSITKRFISKVMRCDTMPLTEMTRTSRLKFLEKHPYPSESVPALSFVSSVKIHLATNLKFAYKYIKYFHGDENDGAVTVSDGIIPGSYVVHLTGFDHYIKPQKHNDLSDSLMVLLGLVAVTLNSTKPNDLTIVLPSALDLRQAPPRPTKPSPTQIPTAPAVQASPIILPPNPTTNLPMSQQRSSTDNITSPRMPYVPPTIFPTIPTYPRMPYYLLPTTSTPIPPIFSTPDTTWGYQNQNVGMAPFLGNSDNYPNSSNYPGNIGNYGSRPQLYPSLHG